MEKETGTKEILSWQRLAITVGIVLVTAAVVGGTVWYLMDQNDQSVAESNSRSVASLQRQIDEIKKAEVKDTLPASTTGTTTTSQGVDIKTLDLKFLTKENTTMGQFLETVYADVNNDGKTEGVVTFQVDGSGGIKDYFIYGQDGTGAKLLVSEKGVGHGQMTLLKNNSGISIKYVDSNDPINQGKPNSDMVLSKEISLVWNGTVFVRSLTNLY